MIPIAAPEIGCEEKAAVLAVLESGQLAQGAQVAEFEAAFARYIGVRHAVAVSSGTAALQLALQANGVGATAGDEVITTPFTFIASANAILLAGAKPVFADIQPDTLNIDPVQVEAKITPRTKAILPVHLYGNPADMDAILSLARAHGLLVVEDCAQAHGAAIGERRVGSFGTGAFSFYPTKNMTVGEGGLITTDDDEAANCARLLRNHGASRKYRHALLGYNLRMSELSAALGRAQLEKLAGWNDARVRHADYLRRSLTAAQPPAARAGVRCVYNQFTVRVPHKRDRLAAQLRSRGVQSAIHYPLPVHRQPLYRALGYADRLPVAEAAAQDVLSLPVHPALSQADLDHIVRAVNGR